jgi:hypothetical protein
VKVSEHEISRLALRMLYIGLGIDVAGAIILFAVGLILENQGLINTQSGSNIDILGYVLLGLSAAELLVIVVLKRRLLNPANPVLSQAKKFRELTGRIMTFYVILYFVALSPAVYGFLFYILSGLQDMFTLMACLTLIGYLMVRPRPEFIARLVEPFDFDQV